MLIDRSSAETYAEWFACLADATRIQILNLLATRAGTLSIAQIVRALDVGQPTVSHHVSKLEATGFVRCQRVGATTLVGVNKRCLRRFPSAAQLVMGGVSASEPPWVVPGREVGRT